MRRLVDFDREVGAHRCASSKKEIGYALR